jgi:phosphoenolpyruvate-protein kinase (PTS system EI component)
VTETFGIPFCPGLATGRLRRSPAEVRTGDVLLVRQDEAARVPGPEAGLLLLDAAPLSHAAIRLLERGVPTVVLTRAQAAALREGVTVSLDGTTGAVISPAPGTPPPEHPPPPPPRAGAPVRTADGVPTFLRASVGDAAGASRALARGAEAVGLLRSERLTPPAGIWPDADFYATAFEAVCTAAHPLPVTVRLADFAPDKWPDWLPALGHGAGGMQGVRLYGVDPVATLVRAQVEAAGRVAARHDLRLLLPFVARPEELEHWRRAIEGWLPSPLAVGCMVETVGAALSLHEILERADFLAIGCNDLLQGLFAAERDRPALAPLLDPYAPAGLRLLRHIASQAEEATGSLQVCGLLPQAPGLLPVLLGFGYRAFSVAPALIPHLAAAVATTDTGAATELAAAVCACGDATAVRAVLDLPEPAAWSLVGLWPGSPSP